MEPKDLAYLKGQLKKEYDTVSQTAFWKDYIARIDDERKISSRHCETDEDVSIHQGIIRGIDLVKRLPADVLGVTPRKILKEA
jgi:hypothetical protein